MRVLVYGMVGTNRGGIETFLLKMNQYMSRNTVFDYVIEEKSCLYENEIKIRGGKVYYIASRTESPFRNIQDNKKLLRRLRFKVDAVYFNLSSLSWFPPVKIAVKMGYRVYVHSHNAEFIAANSDKLHKMVNMYNKKRLSNYNITRLTCSDFATKFMFNSGDKTEMIYNAIPVGQFAFNRDVRDKIRKELGITSEKIIGFAGRINDQKNPLFLPDILKSTLERRSDVKMIILGDGTMREQLEKKILNMGLQEKCIMLGNRTNVNEYMQAMDVFVLPSWHEGLPYVVVEAMTAGLRCIISDRITQEVDVAGNIKYLPLKETADNWGETIVNELAGKHDDRAYWGEFMSRTNFNIENEALRLERILAE